MNRLIAFCLVAAIAAVQGGPAVAQAPMTEAEMQVQAACVAAINVPGYQELTYKLGGGTVKRGDKLVYVPPAPSQLFNPAYATPLDSGIAAAEVREFQSCGYDVRADRYMQMLQMFANGWVTYGLLSLEFANMERDAVRRINSPPR
jgi:hypothetical protein